MKTRHVLSLALFVVSSAAPALAIAAEPPEALPEGVPAPEIPASPAPAPAAREMAPAPAPARAPAPAANVLLVPSRPSQPSLAMGLPPTTNHAPSFDDAGVPDDGSMGTHQSHFWVTLGVRTTLVKTSGFDVFADDDALTQASFAFGRVLFSDGPWSFASSLGWDVGARSAHVRGATTSLEVHRFTLNPEARYHILRRLYLFGRVGGGAALVSSSLQDSISGGERSLHPLCFTLDASAGVALEVLGHKSGLSHTARGWLVLDGGYLFTAPTELVYANERSSPARATPIALGDLALSGPSARLSAAISF
jgi:hypothetical protein